MTAMNVVHMRVKPGREAEFVELHRTLDSSGFSGFRNFWVVKTGERDFCIVGEWSEMDSLVASRPAMIASLDRLRPLLEDLGGGRGVTEPWSGTVVAQVRPDTPAEGAL